MEKPTSSYDLLLADNRARHVDRHEELLKKLGYSPSEVYKKAHNLRHSLAGIPLHSHDPIYNNSKKNK